MKYLCDYDCGYGYDYVCYRGGWLLHGRICGDACVAPHFCPVTMRTILCSEGSLFDCQLLPLIMLTLCAGCGYLSSFCLHLHQAGSELAAEKAQFESRLRRIKLACSRWKVAYQKDVHGRYQQMASALEERYMR